MDMLTIVVQDSEELFILSTLQAISNGPGLSAPAFLVSGWVRAKLSGGECFDFELVCHSEDFEKYKSRLIYRFDPVLYTSGIFQTQRIIKAKAKHLGPQPTLVMRLLSRSQKKYKISLKVLEGGALMEEALTRDFTINAIYCNVSDKSFVDPVGGVDDLNKGLLRSIQPPADLFLSNPSLLFRLLEFSVSYQLTFSTDIVRFFAATDCFQDIFIPCLHAQPATMFSSSRKFFCKAGVSGMLRLALKYGIIDLFLLNFDNRAVFRQLFGLVPNFIERFDSVCASRHKEFIKSKYDGGSPPKSFLMKGRMFLISFLSFPYQKSYAFEFLRMFLFDGKKFPAKCGQLIEELYKVLLKLPVVDDRFLWEEAESRKFHAIVAVIEMYLFDKCAWSFLYIGLACHEFLHEIAVKGKATG